MPKKRILIVTELYPYPGNIYLGTFVTQQLEILRAYYDITVLTVYPRSLRLQNKQPPYSRQENGLTIVSVPYYPLWLHGFGLLGVSVSVRTYVNKLLTRRRLHRAAQQLHAAEPFNLVHGHETYFGDEAGPIGKMLGIPSVFTLHSFYSYHTKIFGKYVTQLALKNLQLCDRYICVSSIAADSYIKAGLQRSQFSIIPNGVNAQHEQHPNTQVRAFAKGRKALLTVGYLSEDKKIDIAIRAFAKLSQETVLVIVGIGTEKKKLQELAQFLGCAERILWLGAVEPKKMYEVYQATDILLHPSVIDSFSMVCLEAMAQGKVVICTTLIGICEFAKNGENIFAVAPNSVEAMVEAAQSVLQNQQRYNAIAKSAYNFGTTMTWQHQVDRIVKLYGQLMK